MRTAMFLVALLAAAVVPGAASAAGAAPGAPTLYVADFLQNGHDGPAGVQVADLLARALSETRRFDVVRIPSGTAGAVELGRLREPRNRPGWLVEGGVRGIRVMGSDSVGMQGLGFGRARGVNRLLRGTPGNLARGSSFAVDGWLRVHDANDGRMLGQRNFQGWTIGLHPNYWYGGGPVGQVLDASVLDERHGATRLVLDMLPLEGRIVSASAGHTAVVDVGSARTVTQGERFVVLPPEGGDPIAILRARRAISATRIEAGVSFPEGGGRHPQPGDLVLSRGW